MKKKRILALMLAAAMTAGLVTGCGSDSSDSKGGSGGSGGKCDVRRQLCRHGH